MDNYFLQNCQVSFSADSINIYTPDEFVALALTQFTCDLAAWAKMLKKKCTLIFSPAFKEPFQISAQLAGSPNQSNSAFSQELGSKFNQIFKASSNESASTQSSEVIVPQLDIDLNEAYQSDKAVYLTEMESQVILFANATALNANNKKPQQMIGSDCIALWDDLVLATLHDYLENDGKLTEYKYPGYRWALNEDGRTWRRDRYIFVSNYQFIPNYLGVRCRYCEIQQAIKVEEDSLSISSQR